MQIDRKAAHFSRQPFAFNRRGISETSGNNSATGPATFPNFWMQQHDASKERNQCAANNAAAQIIGIY